MLNQYDLGKVSSYLNYKDVANLRQSSQFARRSSEERFQNLKRELTPLSSMLINVYIHMVDVALTHSFAIIIVEPKRQIHSLHGYLKETIPNLGEAVIDSIMNSVIGMLSHNSPLHNAVVVGDAAILVSGSRNKPLYVTSGTNPNSIIVDFVEYRYPEFIIVGNTGIKALEKWCDEMVIEKVKPFSRSNRFSFSKGKAILLRD